MNQRMAQTMHLAPRMIQSMEILQLPIMALQERIQQELQENPVLELKESSDEPAARCGRFRTRRPGRRGHAAIPATANWSSTTRGSNEIDFDRLDALSRDWDDVLNEEHRPSRSGMDEEGDKKHDAMQNMASRPQSLQDYLTEQLVLSRTESEQADLARYLITHIDDNGFLTVPDESDPEYHKLQHDPDHKSSRLRPPPSQPGRAGRGLSRGHDRRPDRGSAARRAEARPAGRRRTRSARVPAAAVDAGDAAPRGAARADPATIWRTSRTTVCRPSRRSTGFDLQTIKDAIEVLQPPQPAARDAVHRREHPLRRARHPRRAHRGRRIHGTPARRLAAEHLHQPALHRPVQEKGADPKTKEYLKRKIQSAQWLQESIEQRRNTLEKVTKAIIQHQRAFLEKGPEHIEPLKMQQIADQVGVHVTTVSRAVDDKWVQTPRGIFPLKRFFGGGTHNTATGEEVAWETIKQKLLEIIDQEDKSNPLSDEDLVAKLNEAGYPVKRRTVTKYRKMANIPSSRQRKDWTAAPT